MSNVTPSGIVRPLTGSFATFDVARTEARNLNAANGRGYRAVRARTVGYAVVFLSAVANFCLIFLMCIA